MKTLTDKVNRLSTIIKRSTKKIKKKSTYITDNSFYSNGNMSHYLHRFVKYKF